MSGEDEERLHPSVDLAFTIAELISAYEKEHGESGDTGFNMEVYLVNGTRISLPYCDHGNGAITLMDDLQTPPRPRVIPLQHVVELSIDPTCKSEISRCTQVIQQKGD